MAVWVALMSFGIRGDLLLVASAADLAPSVLVRGARRSRVRLEHMALPHNKTSPLVQPRWWGPAQALGSLGTRGICLGVLRVPRASRQVNSQPAALSRLHARAPNARRSAFEFMACYSPQARRSRGLTPRSRRGPTALHLAREAPWYMMRFAGQAQYRRSRLNSNVRPANPPPSRRVRNFNPQHREIEQPMSVEQDISARLSQLIAQSGALSRGNQNDQCVDPAQRAACSAWLTASQNVVHLVLTRPDAPYRKKTDRLAERDHGFLIHHAVAELGAVLQSLLHDAANGLLASVADQARAEVFDDFLDQAAYYAKNSKKQEAGTIAGVVFEDAIRRYSQRLGIAEKGQKLDTLISELASRNEFTAVKAKRARAAADVRTKATHAQWNEFELDDVLSTIEFTRSFIESKLAQA
jgi:hypothetical protein